MYINQLNSEAMSETVLILTVNWLVIGRKFFLHTKEVNLNMGYSLES